jgi:hypothetical protein
MCQNSSCKNPWSTQVIFSEWGVEKLICTDSKGYIETLNKHELDQKDVICKCCFGNLKRFSVQDIRMETQSGLFQPRDRGFLMNSVSFKAYEGILGNLCENSKLRIIFRVDSLLDFKQKPLRYEIRGTIGCVERVEPIIHDNSHFFKCHENTFTQIDYLVNEFGKGLLPSTIWWKLRLSTMISVLSHLNSDPKPIHMHLYSHNFHPNLNRVLFHGMGLGRNSMVIRGSPDKELNLKHTIVLVESNLISKKAWGHFVNSSQYMHNCTIWWLSESSDPANVLESIPIGLNLSEGLNDHIECKLVDFILEDTNYQESDEWRMVI